MRSDLKYKNAASYAALDIYYREDGTGKPVLLFIHGGGWVTGDKSNITRNPDMLRSFLDAGYVVACPNFRLVERSLQSQVRYHHMAEDIAAAIKWLNGNVHRYGGDPAAFVLVGYSSGAHLASLVATDERYLEQQGLDTKIIRAVSAWDVPAYDVPRALTLMKGTSLEPKIHFNQALFGRSRSEQLEASPLNYLDREGSHVQFQLISAGTMRGQSQTISQRVSESFEDALTRVGHKVEHHHYPNSEHSDLPMRYGKGGASDISSKVESFLASVK